MNLPVQIMQMSDTFIILSNKYMPHNIYELQKAQNTPDRTNTDIKVDNTVEHGVRLEVPL